MHCLGNQVEIIQRKSSCETSVKNYKMKMPKRNFHGKHPSKDCKLKLCKRSFRAGHPLKTVSQTCGNETFVRDILQKLQDEDVKATLSCETSFQNCKLKMWKWRFCVRHSSKIANRNCEIEISLETYCHTSKLQIEVVKAKFPWETSIKNYKLQFEWFQWRGFSQVVAVMWFQSNGFRDVVAVILCQWSSFSGFF